MRAVNDNTVSVYPSLSSGEPHLAVPGYNVFSHSLLGILLPNRETKIGSASLVLFRIH